MRLPEAGLSRRIGALRRRSPWGGIRRFSEISDYLDTKQQRHRLFPRAALVGLLAGILALAFRAALYGGEHLRHALQRWARAEPTWGWIFPILFGAAGATLAVALTRRFAPEAAGSGIPHLKAVLLRLRRLRWRRLLPVKFVGGVAAIGGGLALGREGPTVQMGGAVGAATAAFLKSRARERRTLISAGAGAGLSAAFNAPLAGTVFVLEEIQRDFRAPVFGAAFIAAAIADIIARFASGPFPVMEIPSYPVPPLATLPAFALLGVAAGALGILFNRTLVGSLDLFARLGPRRILLATAVVGGAAGLLGWFLPVAIGSGHDLAERVITGRFPLAMILVLFVLRFLLTLGSYGTGAPGGIFSPMLVLGALLGYGIGQLCGLALPSTAIDPAIFAMVGMAAYFTAIARAPLTGVVLVIEMTGNYWQMLPLLVSCFFAYAVAELLRDVPIYEALLRRDLRRSGAIEPPREPVVAEFEIQPGSAFDGKAVRDLGLPPGCILVRCRDGDREWVPTAATRLQAHMRIDALIPPGGEPALRQLHEGTSAEPQSGR